MKFQLLDRTNEMSKITTMNPEPEVTVERIQNGTEAMAHAHLLEQPNLVVLHIGKQAVRHDLALANALVRDFTQRPLTIEFCPSTRKSSFRDPSPPNRVSSPRSLYRRFFLKHKQLPNDDDHDETQEFTKNDALRGINTNERRPMADHDEPLDTEKDQVILLRNYAQYTITRENVRWTLRHIEALIENERLISAGMLIERLEEALLDTTTMSLEEEHQYSEDREIARRRCASPRFVRTLERKQAGLDALDEFYADRHIRNDDVVQPVQPVQPQTTTTTTGQDDNSSWKVAQTFVGITTSYKPSDDGSIWVKLDGECHDVVFLDALAVLRETDLYSEWAPFCTRSSLIAYLERVEILTYLQTSVPFILTRETIVHAFGIDASYECGGVLLLGQSIQSLDEIATTPLSPNRPAELQDIRSQDRMDIRGFRALIEPLSRTSAHICIVANVNLNFPNLPQSLINFGMKKMAGMLLYLLVKEAGKIDHTSKTNVYAKRMTLDPMGFYTWLRPRLERYFAELEAGTLPDKLMDQMQHRNLVRVAPQQKEEENLRHTTTLEFEPVHHRTDRLVQNPEHPLSAQPTGIPSSSVKHDTMFSWWSSCCMILIVSMIALRLTWQA